MKIENIHQQMVTFMVDSLGLEADEVTPTARFTEDLELDSLDMVELVSILESETGIELDDATSEKLTCLGDVVALLESRQVSGERL